MHLQQKFTMFQLLYNDFFARYLRVVVSCMYSTFRAYLKLGLYFTQSSFTCGWSLFNEVHLYVYQALMYVNERRESKYSRLMQCCRY